MALQFIRWINEVIITQLYYIIKIWYIKILKFAFMCVFYLKKIILIFVIKYIFVRFKDYINTLKIIYWEIYNYNI